MEILRLMQIAGGNFPIGCFSQSLGLESYIANKTISNGIQLREFLETYINNTLCSSEMPILIEAFRKCEENNLDGLYYLNELGIATKTTKESREAAIKSGKAMLRIGKELVKDNTVNVFYTKTKDEGIAYNVAFSIIAQKMGVSVSSTVGAFVFSGVNSLIQAAIKLVPLGNLEGQIILTDLMPAMEAASMAAFDISINNISSFTPAIDIASIEHETLGTRLYMS